MRLTKPSNFSVNIQYHPSRWLHLTINQNKFYTRSIFSGTAHDFISSFCSIHLHKSLTLSEWNYYYTVDDANRIGGKSKITHFRFDIQSMKCNMFFYFTFDSMMQFYFFISLPKLFNRFVYFVQQKTYISAAKKFLYSINSKWVQSVLIQLYAVWT